MLVRIKKTGIFYCQISYLIIELVDTVPLKKNLSNYYTVESLDYLMMSHHGNTLIWPQPLANKILLKTSLLDMKLLEKKSYSGLYEVPL